MPESPFRTERFAQLPPESLIEMYRNKRIKLPFDPRDLACFLDREHGELELRVLPYHHRSADFADKRKETVREKGGHGHVYCTFDVKGIGFLFPEGFESRKDKIPMGSLAGYPEAYIIPGSDEYSWGYNSLGLLDERAFVKTAQNADRLADAGARVETIVAAYRLGEIRLKGKPIDIKTYKKQEAASLRASRDPDQRAMAQDLMENFDPMIAIRAMRSVFRLRDLSDATSQDEVNAMLEEACANLNHEAAQQDRPERFDPKTREGRERWIKFIAFWTGKNVGIMQREGLAHIFLHMGNLTLAGEVVDLDSVSSVIQRRHYQARPKDRERHKKEPFYHETSNGCVFIHEDMGKHRTSDDRFGLPRCIIKDFRDSCFSFRQMLRGKLAQAIGGNRVVNMAVAREMVRGYLEGLENAEPLAEIGVTNARLREVFTIIAESVIGRDEHYAPIPTDPRPEEE